jgi:hypothetical protein
MCVEFKKRICPRFPLIVDVSESSGCLCSSILSLIGGLRIQPSSGSKLQQYLRPVVNDVTFRILSIAMLIFHLKAKIINIETVFFHGDFNGEIICGLVQSVRQFYTKTLEALKSCDFKGSEVYPYLREKHSSLGMVMTSIYVDDCLTIGTGEDIHVLKVHYFALKVEENLADYLICKIFQERDQGKFWKILAH